MHAHRGILLLTTKGPLREIMSRRHPTPQAKSRGSPSKLSIQSSMLGLGRDITNLQTPKQLQTSGRGSYKHGKLIGSHKVMHRSFGCSSHVSCHGQGQSLQGEDLEKMLVSSFSNDGLTVTDWWRSSLTKVLLGFVNTGSGRPQIQAFFIWTGP